MKRKIFITAVVLILITSVIASAAPFETSDATLEKSDSLGNLQNIAWNHNGTILIVSDFNNDEIRQYELSEPWNVSTATQVHNIASWDAVPRDIEFADNGTKMYEAGDIDDAIIYWELSKPYNISTATAITSLSIDDSPSGVTLGDNGSRLYVTGFNDGTLYEYLLSTPYDVTTATLNQSVSVSSDPQSIDFNSNGSKMYIIDETGQSITGYDLVNNWDPSNWDSTSSISTQGSSEIGEAVWDTNGNRLYEVSDGNIYQYNTFDATVSGFVKDSSGNSLDNVSVSTDGQSLTTGTDGFYQLALSNGEHDITFSKDGYLSNTTTITVADNNIDNLNVTLLEEETLELDISPYMKHGSTQSFTVTFGGSVVTDNSIVSSSNGTVVSVDNQQNTLTATSDKSINKEVTITAIYEGEQVTRNVTVANRTIENIGIMPSSEWTASAMGIDEEQTTYGIGSKIQWLFFIILLAGTAGNVSRNPWIAIGVMLALEIIVWVLGFISIGFVLASVFMAIFFGLMKMDMPESSSQTTNIQIDSGPDFHSDE